MFSWRVLDAIRILGMFYLPGEVEDKTVLSVLGRHCCVICAGGRDVGSMMD